MKIPIISDIHFGARNDNPIFLEHFRRFFDEQFFSYLQLHDIRDVFILGDVLDRRKYINIATANFVRREFIQKLSPYNVYILAGNHDCYHSNTLMVNSLEEIIQARAPQKQFTIITEPCEIPFTWGKTLWLPWICAENQDKSLELVRKTDASVVFGHLQLKGFEMHKGHICESGIDIGLFNRFRLVVTGHFHHKSTKGNITYLGAPYEITWADYDDIRGFHVFDTSNISLEFIPNNNNVFYKLVYDDSGTKKVEDVLNWDFNRFQNCYIKVIVKSKNNPYWFDIFIDTLDKYAEDVKIIENINHKLTDINVDEKVENTPAILRKYGEESNLLGDKKKLVDLLINLYSEALMIE